jgi:hypothetical protein
MPVAHDDDRVRFGPRRTVGTLADVDQLPSETAIACRRLTASPRDDTPETTECPLCTHASESPRRQNARPDPVRGSIRRTGRSLTRSPSAMTSFSGNGTRTARNGYATTTRTPGRTRSLSSQRAAPASDTLARPFRLAAHTAHQLGFESGPRQGSARGPSPAGTARTSSATAESTRNDHREAIAVAPTPKRQGRWADAGFGLRRAFANAAQPGTRGNVRAAQRNQHGSHHRCCHRRKSRHHHEKRSHLRGNTWHVVQVHRLCRRARVDIGPMVRPAQTRRPRAPPFPAAPTFDVSARPQDHPLLIAHSSLGGANAARLFPRRVTR